MAWISSIKKQEMGDDGIIQFSIQVTANNRNITVDQFQEQEKNMHLQLFRFNQAELEMALEKKLQHFISRTPMAAAPLDSGVGLEPQPKTALNTLCARCDTMFELAEDGKNRPGSRAISTQDVVSRIIEQYNEVFESHQRFPKQHFGDDSVFQALTNEMFENKLYCEHKLSLWLDYHMFQIKQQRSKLKTDEPDRAFDIYHFPLISCNRMYLIELRRQLDSSRYALHLAQNTTGRDCSKELQVVRTLCIELLKAKGRIAHDCKDIKEWTGTNAALPKQLQNKLVRMHPLLEAACSGWGEEDVAALLDLGVSIQDVLDPVSKQNCIHLASMHGNVYFLALTLQRTHNAWLKDPSAIKVRDLIFLQEGQTKPDINAHPRRTALYLAAEHGHRNCLQELIKHLKEPEEAFPNHQLSPLYACVGSLQSSCVRFMLEHVLTDSKTTAAASSTFLPSWRPLLDRPSHSDEVGLTPLIRAASGGDEEIVRMLLEHGADPSKTCLLGDCRVSAKEDGGRWRMIEENGGNP